MEEMKSVQVPARFALCYKSNCRRSGECLRYQATAHVLKYAYGMADVLDSLPHRTAKEVKHCLLGHFGKTHFYRLMRKQRCFRPEDQEYVVKVFQHFGAAGKLVFDSYRFDYEW